MRFLVGLLFGIAIAVAVVYYINMAPNPFVDKGFNNASHQESAPGNIASNQPLILAPGTKMQAVSGSESANQEARANQPDYDFYDVLQGRKELSQASEAEREVKPVRFAVSLGSFNTADAANNLKAKVALLGYTAKISQKDTNGLMIYSVILGTFDNQEDAKEALEQIKQQDINGDIVNLNN